MKKIWIVRGSMAALLGGIFYIGALYQPGRNRQVKLAPKGLLLAGVKGLEVRQAEMPPVAASAEATEAAPHLTPTSAQASAPSYDIVALDGLFARALTHSDGEDRRTLLRGLAEFLAKNDVEKAREYVLELLRIKDGGDAYAFTQEFVRLLSGRDPAAVIAWSQILPDNLKEVAYQFGAREWTSRDPKASAQWVSSIGSAALRATAIRAMSQELSTSDPRGFGPGWAAGLARTEDGPRFSDLIAQQWARTDPQAVWAWISTLPSSADSDRALVAVANTMAEKDPSAAVAWAKKFPVGEVRNQAVQAAVTKWAEKDPAAAAAWVSLEPSVPGLMEASIHAIVAQWMRKDPAAATKWIENAAVNPRTKDYILAVAASQSSPSP